MPEMVTCLWFDGAAEEAARRYTELFPNSSVDAVVRSPADNPSVSEGAVLTVEFTLDGRRFLGLNGGPAFTPNEAVSIQVLVQDQAEVDHYWDGLVAGGGQESRCGWLKDPWGFSWQVVPKRLTELMGDPDPDRARAAMQSMMTMQRIDVAELERAVAAEPAGWSQLPALPGSGGDTSPACSSWSSRSGVSAAAGSAFAPGRPPVLPTPLSWVLSLMPPAYSSQPGAAR